MATSTTKGSPVVVHDQTNLLPRTQLLVVFGTLAIAFLIAYADQNGVGVALPTIARELNARDTISWAGTSSMIANTVFQVLYGRLSDIFGRKKVYLSAVLLLAIADILCATAQTAWAFYLFRGIAGIATGGINSLTMMIVSDIVTLQERGRYQGILGSCIGLGNTIGPFLSSAFAQHATWRGFFYLISPLMLLCAVGSFFLLPSSMPKGNGLARAKLIDIWGLVSGSIAIICILIPISGGGSYFAWNSTLVISMLAVGGVATVAFILVEWKVAKLPMVPLSMFRTPAVTAILVQNLLFGYCYYAELYFLPLYFENVRRVTPLVSAALLVPLVISQMIFSVCSGFYISHYSRYGEVIWFGFICWTVGASVLCTLKQDTSLGVIIVALIILGVGVGNVFQPCLIAIQAHSPKELRAVIISNRNFFRALGGAIGLACSSLVLQTSLGKALPDDLSYLSRDSYVLPSLSDFSTADQNAIRAAYAKASRTVFISMAPIMGFCLVICVFIQDKGLQRKDETAPPPPIPTMAEPTSNAEKGVLKN
ncbi:hypothetical protein ACN38_g10471 [Penicillium nordicum]|uniref:Major facilitator superfamily (MFS) profile domain-containing protein n=1 Tax=Penicillium nordicum TaxID=229535 RepID=A0A0M9WBT0_9EURO|nr:hypothetical protein ACN38_g10471 [Penicillium nordicum]